jgi:hypothetical protein
MLAPPHIDEEIQAANLAVALDLAAAGIPIFPARVFKNGQSDKWQKSPLVKRWQKTATTDRALIVAWFGRNRDAVPGIELGKAGLVVIDADRHGGPDGVAALHALATENGGLPVGPITMTPGDGQHHIFRQPDGEMFGNGTGALPDGIDVRGKGGWIVAPGSVRPDGAIWSAAEGTPPLAEAFRAETVPVLPGWIATLIRNTGAHRQTPPPPTWTASEEARHSLRFSEEARLGRIPDK